MRSTQAIAAVAAFAGFAVAQTSTCTKDIEITEPTPSIDCKVVKADIIVDSSVSGELRIDGPEEIDGDLFISNATGLISISSNSITSVKNFELEALESLNSLNMESLRTITNLKMQKLGELRNLVFGSEGVTEADTVTISDTDIEDLTGFKLATVKSFTLDNNKRLTKFESDLVNVTEKLYFDRNGRDQLEVDLPKLEQVGMIDVRSIKSFRAPLLEGTEKGFEFNTCPEMETLFLPNVTKIGGGITVIDNDKLTNLTFPKLKEISGTLRIENNTDLVTIDGFPVLESCSDINMGGNFEEIDFPKLDTVRGTSTVASTSDDEEVCEFFEGRAKDDNVIAAKNNCEYDNQDANEGGDSSQGSGKSRGGGGGDDDAAGMVSVNSALLGLALIAGVAQML